LSHLRLSRPRLSRLLLLLVAVGSTVALLAGPGGAPAAAREHRAAGAKEVTIRNRAEIPIVCSLPTFQGGKDFRVEPLGDHQVKVSDLAGVQLVNKVTCAKQTVSVIDSSLTSGDLTLEFNGSKFTALGYFYVHAHFTSDVLPDCHSTSPPGRQHTWAETAAGFCRGYFAGGSAPYDRTEAFTSWSPAGGGAIQLKMAVRHDARVGVGFECVTKNRGSDACYSDSATQGSAPPGQQGGPLKLDVQNDRNGLRYVLLRGFCANSDQRCLPH
jgi:hypothetical protein